MLEWNWLVYFVYYIARLYKDILFILRTTILRGVVMVFLENGVTSTVLLVGGCSV